jgi:hypothetical protein
MMPVSQHSSFSQFVADGRTGIVARIASER